MQHSEWLELRKTGIGGSDAAAILGLNPWKTNQQLFDEKTGIVESADLSNNAAAQYGINAEEPLRQLFAMDYPEYEVMHEEHKIYRHPEYPFLLGTFDGVLTNKETGEKGILEIKTTEIMRSMIYEQWNEKIPQTYFVQVLHYLLVSGFGYAVLKAQLKTRWSDEIRLTTKHYFINRNDFVDDIEFLKNAEIDFWQNNIMKGVRPGLILPGI